MDIYTSVTHRILEELARGVIPWRKTWTAALPRSLNTGKEYRGVNVLLLLMSGRTSRYWLTYRQAQSLGGQVRKGERSSSVVYWHWREAEELDALEKRWGSKPAACVPFVSSVFNLDQIEGIQRPQDDHPVDRHARIEVAESLMGVMPERPRIVHSKVTGPQYCIQTDCVTLPHLSQFESADEYYSTLFHETVHATAAPHRLNRAPKGEDRMTSYSFEELVAEFGACFLCGLSGIDNQETVKLSASYIADWAQVIGGDVRLVMQAATAAQLACDYVRGKVGPETESAAA